MMNDDYVENIYDNWYSARRAEKALPEYREPVISNIYRENGNYTVHIGDNVYTYTEAEVLRNFPRQAGGR